MGGGRGGEGGEGRGSRIVGTGMDFLQMSSSSYEFLFSHPHTLITCKYACPSCLARCDC